MPDTDRLAARLDAVERALTGSDIELGNLPDAAATAERLEEMDDRLADLETDLADLEAAVRALRGYVGNVDAVNEAVERRADAALAAAGDDGSNGGVGPGTDGRGDDRDDADPGDVERAIAAAESDDGWRDACAPAAGQLENDADAACVSPAGRRRAPDGPDPSGASDPRQGEGANPERGGVSEPNQGEGLGPEEDTRDPASSDAGAGRWLDRHDAATDGGGRCPTCGESRHNADGTSPGRSTDDAARRDATRGVDGAGPRTDADRATSDGSLLDRIRGAF